MAQVAREAGFDPLFCGALRDPQLPRRDEWQGVPTVRLGPFFPLLNGRRPWLYLRSIAAYNRELLRLLRSRRPAIVHASDVETMPASALYRLFHRCRLVYNIHDNVGQRYDIALPLRAALNLVEGICVLASDVALVPEQFRRDALPRWCRGRVAVVRNTPGEIAFTPPPPARPRIRVFFGGWLDWGRGLEALIDIAESSERIELRVAGEGSDEIIRVLRAHPRVTYLGFLDHAAVLEETRQCHIVPALYDPVRAINRFAASNKLAEALAIGRPVLINSELEIARQFSDRACAMTAPYAEIARYWPQVERLIDDWPAYLRACADARREFERAYAWAPVHRAMWEALAPAVPSSGERSGEC
jgi:glycosyltransferase involved in cell wall biosynthesis